MRLRTTVLAPPIALLALLALVTAVAAGSSATVTLDDEIGEPLAGEQIDIGFMLWQHGATPVSWPDAWLTARNPETGETVTVDAVPAGAEGHYVATLTLPSEGTWTWSIETRELEVTTAMEPMVAVSRGSAAVTSGSAAMSSVPMSLAAVAGALAITGLAASVVLLRRRSTTTERQVSARA